MNMMSKACLDPGCDSGNGSSPHTDDGLPRNNRCRFEGRQGLPPNKPPRFPMIVTGLALLIIHSVIVIALASLG